MKKIRVIATVIAAVAGGGQSTTQSDVLSCRKTKSEQKIGLPQFVQTAQKQTLW